MRDPILVALHDWHTLGRLVVVYLPCCDHSLTVDRVVIDYYGCVDCDCVCGIKSRVRLIGWMGPLEAA